MKEGIDFLNIFFLLVVLGNVRRIVLRLCVLILGLKGYRIMINCWLMLFCDWYLWIFCLNWKIMLFVNSFV